MKKSTKIIAVIVVVLLVAAVVVLNSSNGNTSLISQDNQKVSQAQLTALYSIANNETIANRIGIGIVQGFPSNVSGSPIMVGGKPTVLYMGAEYCPFCAATRWGLILALMRFGSFSGLEYMTSSATDVYASTPTFTFVNSTYQSQYINFITVELQNNTEAPLQVAQPWENQSIAKYDPVTPDCPYGECIPFIDFENKSVQLGSPYSPGILWNTHYNWQQIINMLGNPNSTVALGIIGSANIFTAHICAIDNFTPASVCSQQYVKAALAQ